MPYYVYILQCKDGTYYTGYTKNPKQRLKQHKKGQGAKHTKTHQPQKIVYIEKHNNHHQATKREHQIKKLTHKQKQHLINNQKH